jgi:hypothetical protein
VVRRTGIEIRGGDFIEHVGVHVRMDGSIRGRVVSDSDENGVALCYSDTQQISGEFLNVSL